AVAVALSGIVLVALALTTARQVARWKDTRTLFTHTLRVTRDNPVAHHYLGDVMMLAGRPDSAVVHFEESLRLAPDLGDAHNKLGAALGALGRREEAIAQFE